MKKDELLWVLVATGTGIIGFFITLIKCGDWERDGFMLMLLAGIIFGLIIVLSSLYFLLNFWKKRYAALKAMGKNASTAVAKDKTARLAFKGIYQLMKGDLAKSEDYLTKALSLADMRQNQVFCVEWLVRLYETMENDGKLLWAYRKAAEFSPDNPEYQSRLGHAYYVDGDLKRAEYCFEQALHFDPRHGYSHFSLAKIYMVRGEEEKAIAKLNELTTIQENHPLVFAELAVFHAMRGEDDKCREYYEKSIMCGYERPAALAEKMTAIYTFNKAENVDGTSLPSEYYRRIEREECKEEEDSCENCTQPCEHRKKTEKDGDNAGNE